MRLISETIVITYDEIIDIEVMKVPVSKLRPHGVKYSFNYRVINQSGRWVSVIRYDNAHVIRGHKEADHRHVLDREPEEIVFTSPREIYDEIIKLAKKLRGEIDEIKRL